MNAVEMIEAVTPADYDYDKGVIKSVNLMTLVKAFALKAPELKVVTNADGSQHFMCRVKGDTLDDVADFICHADGTMTHLFTGSESPDESDFIFIGESR